MVWSMALIKLPCANALRFCHRDAGSRADRWEADESSNRVEKTR